MIFASEDFEVVAPPLTQPTRLEYLADTYRFAGEGQLLEIGEGEKGKFFVFDQTIFYPKGGGQPSDLGTITFANGVEYPVHLVLFDGSTGRVQHYVEGEVDTGLIGLGAAFEIDQARRSENAKAHSAGHLLDNTDQLMMSAILNRNIDKYEEILQSALRLKIESPTCDILAWSIYATSYDGNLNFLESTMSYIKSSNIPLNNLSGEFMDTLFEDTVNNTQYCCLDYLYGMVKLGILKRPSTKVEEYIQKKLDQGLIKKQEEIIKKQEEVAVIKKILEETIA
jgi:hypothetical protein